MDCPTFSGSQTLNEANCWSVFRIFLSVLLSYCSRHLLRSSLVFGGDGGGGSVGNGGQVDVIAGCWSKLYPGGSCDDCGGEC